MRKVLMALLIATAVVAASALCEAGTVHENQKYVLKDLHKAGLKLEYYDAGAQKEWWCRTDAAEGAVDLLQDFGIQILGDEQRVGEPGMAFIHIGVHAFERRDPNYIGLWGYNITVSLRETVKLDRNQEVTAHAITWTKSAEGTVAQYQLLDIIPFRIMTLVEDFVRDYLEANRYRARIPELEDRMSYPPLGRRIEYDKTIIRDDLPYKCE